MSHFQAVSDFRRARRQAAMERIVARLTGKSADLLSFDEVRQRLGARTAKHQGLREIPLDAIVGSVGRYTDFTRSFLPRQDDDQERWIRVMSAVTALGGLPPIDVYQIGDAYFVLDGNHRVSVARQLEAKSIQAWVTEIQTKVPLSPDVQPDELILKAEYAEFLERTRLDESRPQADLIVTAPGRYPKLLQHIEVHRYYMGLDLGREFSFQEAAGHWYDEVYTPVVQVIRARGILRDFPQRTETDLYLWVSEHRAALEKALGWEVETGSAAADLAARHSTRPRRVAARVSERILDVVTPDGLEAGPSPGQWRSERLASHRDERLFLDILVPVSGQEVGWRALNQALEVARREGGRLRGLYVVPSKEHLESEKARNVKLVFEGLCQDVGVAGKLSIEAGKVARKITALARWTDLIVVNLAYPPGEQPVARLSSGFRTLLLRSSRPVLAVPSVRSPLQRGLLAYDGSPKADEALYIAAYLAGRWQIHLAVITVLESRRVRSDVISRARAYLQAQGVQATYVERSGPVAEAILDAATEKESDLILTGGYGHSPVLEAMVGSTVDHLLRKSPRPLLICR